MAADVLNQFLLITRVNFGQCFHTRHWKNKEKASETFYNRAGTAE